MTFYYLKNLWFLPLSYRSAPVRDFGLTKRKLNALSRPERLLSQFSMKSCFDAQNSLFPLLLYVKVLLFESIIDLRSRFTDQTSYTPFHFSASKYGKSHRSWYLSLQGLWNCVWDSIRKEPSLLQTCSYFQRRSLHLCLYLINQSGRIHLASVGLFVLCFISSDLSCLCFFLCSCQHSRFLRPDQAYYWVFLARILSLCALWRQAPCVWL